MKSVRTIQALCGALLLGATTYSFAATVKSVRVWSGPDSTRVVFELTRPRRAPRFRAGRSRSHRDRPARHEGRGPLSLPEPKGVVAAVRAGGRAGGELRVVLELTKAAKAKTFLLAPNDQYGNRLVVDLVQGDDTRRSCSVRRRGHRARPRRGRSRSTRATAATIPARAAATARARRTSCSRSLVESPTRSTRSPACTRCSCAAATTSCRFASGWRSRTRRRRTSSCRSTRIRIATRRATGATVYVLIGEGRDRRGRAAARAARERVRPDRRRVARRHRPDARARAARSVAERGVEREHGRGPAARSASCRP